MKHLHHRCVPLYRELPSDLFLMQMVFESVHMIAHAGPYLPDHSRYADKPVAPWLSLSLSLEPLKQTLTRSHPPGGCGAALERCLPGGLIFYSLCPSVA